MGSFLASNFKGYKQKVTFKECVHIMQKIINRHGHINCITSCRKNSRMQGLSKVHQQH